MIVGNIENGLERGFVKHCLNYVLIIDPNKPIGPDGICNRLLKELAPEFTPITKDIYNQSFREGVLPDSLKRSIIRPVPKISPPQDIKSDL